MPSTAMIDDRRVGGFVLSVLLMTNLWFSLTVSAQDVPPQIPVESLKADPIGEVEQKQIDDFVNHWSARLFSDDPVDIGRAKDALAHAPRTLAGKPFLTAYETALAPTVLKAANDNDPLVRLAAMVIAGRIMQSGAMVNACIDGIEDPHPAVRYHAAKAIAELFDRNRTSPTPVLPARVQEQIHDAIRNQADDEKLEAVYQQLGRAAAYLSIPKGFNLSMQLLQKHLQVLQSNPRILPDTARDMFYAMLIRLVARDVAQQNVNAEYRQLVTATGRALAILKQRIANDQVSDQDHQQSWAELMLVVEDQVWNSAARELDPSFNVNQYPKPSSRVKNEDWSMSGLGAEIERWIGKPGTPGLLTQSGIAAPMDQMIIIPPEPETEEPNETEDPDETAVP